MIGNDNEATLNTLIATTLDSADGYRKAAEKAENERYRSLFLEFAGERERCVRQLQDEVRQLGGNPEDDGSILAAAHRAFLSLRDAVTGSDDRSVIAEVERGEDYIKNKYETALESGNLSGSAEQAVRQAYQSVREGHDRVSQLKHSLEGEHEATSTGMGGSNYEGTSGGSGSATGGFGSGTGSVGTGASGFGGSAGTTGANTPNTGYGSSPGGATGGGAMTGGSGNDRT
jgi:uncharacterized protein (TIGR02284 family)